MRMTKRELFKSFEPQIRAIIKEEVAASNNLFRKKVKQQVKEQVADYISLLESVNNGVVKKRVMPKKTPSSSMKRMMEESEEDDILGSEIRQVVEKKQPSTKAPVDRNEIRRLMLAEETNPYESMSNPTSIDDLISSAVDEEERMETIGNRSFEAQISKPIKQLHEASETNVDELESVDYSAFLAKEKDPKELSELENIERERRKILDKFKSQAVGE